MRKGQLQETELEELLSFINSKYTKDEIDWYLSLVPLTSTDKEIEIILSNSSYANEK